jgi:hypothetical protein
MRPNRSRATRSWCPYSLQHCKLSRRSDVQWQIDDLIRAVTVPFAEHHDHAEGLTVVTRAPVSVLVSYDSPHPWRFEGVDGSGVMGDIFDVPL